MSRPAVATNSQSTHRSELYVWDKSETQAGSTRTGVPEHLDEGEGRACVSPFLFELQQLPSRSFCLRVAAAIANASQATAQADVLESGARSTSLWDTVWQRASVARVHVCTSAPQNPRYAASTSRQWLQLAIALRKAASISRLMRTPTFQEPTTPSSDPVTYVSPVHETFENDEYHTDIKQNSDANAAHKTIADPTDKTVRMVRNLNSSSSSAASLRRSVRCEIENRVRNRWQVPTTATLAKYKDYADTTKSVDLGFAIGIGFGFGQQVRTLLRRSTAHPYLNLS